MINFFKSKLSVKIKARWYRFLSKFSEKSCQGRVGDGSYVDPSVHVLRWRSVSVGKNTCIAFGTSINVNDYKSIDPTVVIGNNCWVGLRNFFSPGALICLEDYCMTGPDCKFIGTGHVFSDPSKPYIVTGTEVGSQIKLGVNCLLGASVVVMNGVTVGYGSVIGACSLVLSDVPPFSLVVGNPGRVIKRYDFASKEWISSKDYTEQHELMLPNESDYLCQLKMNHPHVAMPWRAAGKSMGDTY